ncbi:MAG TPA: sulfite exporter TauE/SafE family protein [Saprospiraceae bacterium]|nr:sulfite exporter TauE/SafE family protein [Saprospiraceae bacterium]
MRLLVHVSRQSGQKITTLCNGKNQLRAQESRPDGAAGTFFALLRMEWIISLTAFLASLLTLFSGFGLGTILTPVFGLFFPIHVAVALTGIVHLLNNLFKTGLLGRHANRGMLWRFGLPSVIGGFLGAWVLVGLTRLPILHVWYWNGKPMEISLLKVAIALLMIVFALMELVPALKKMQFASRYLTLGGLVSGFFGGLSGNQGALRSAFLLQSGLDKQAFIATGVVVACMVDLTRLPVYFSRFSNAGLVAEWPTLLLATLAAFAGAYLGARYLHKVTLTAVRTFTAVMIISIALLLGSGIL